MTVGVNITDGFSCHYLELLVGQFCAMFDDCFKEIRVKVGG